MNEFPFNQFLNLNNNENQILNNIQLENVENPKSADSNLTMETDDTFSLEELKGLTNEILKTLQVFISPQKFNAYFKETFTVTKISDENIEFAVTTPFIKRMIEQYNREQLESAIIDALGKRYNYEIIVVNSDKTLSSNDSNVLNSINPSKNEPFSQKYLSNYSVNKGNSVREVSFSINDLMPSQDDLESEIESKVIEHMNETTFGKLIDSRKTFDNFISGPSNNFAHASAVAVAKQPGKIYPSLYIHGNSGLGKTHLLHAIANKIIQDRPLLKVCITTAQDFMNEIVEATKQGTIINFRKKYAEKIDVLMIDDIHELNNKQFTQNEFFHVFNELHNNGKQLVFTSDKHPKEIDGVEERIKTRLSWGIVVDIQQPDLETRAAILKRKAVEEDIFLPDDVVNLIARSIKSNIRELEGSLVKLGAYSSVFNVDIDIDIAKEQLKLDDNPDARVITMDVITKEVSLYFNIPVADIKSKARNKEITKARHIAMYLSNKLVKTTLVRIGQFFGGRDHSSVLHAIDKIQKLVKENDLILGEIYEIENKM